MYTPGITEEDKEKWTGALFVRNRGVLYTDKKSKELYPEYYAAAKAFAIRFNRTMYEGNLLGSEMPTPSYMQDSE